MGGWARSVFRMSVFILLEHESLLDQSVWNVDINVIIHRINKRKVDNKNRASNKWWWWWWRRCVLHLFVSLVFSLKSKIFIWDESKLYIWFQNIRPYGEWNSSSAKSSSHIGISLTKRDWERVSKTFIYNYVKIDRFFKFFANAIASDIISICYSFVCLRRCLLLPLDLLIVSIRWIFCLLYSYGDIVFSLSLSHFLSSFSLCSFFSDRFPCIFCL